MATDYRLCPDCGCPVQRTHDGSLDDGLADHYRTVHPSVEVPA